MQDLLHVECALCIGFNHIHLPTCHSKHIGNTYAHGAAANHAHIRHWARGDAFDLWHFHHFTLCKKGMNQTCTLWAVNALQKQLALVSQCLVKRHVQACTHRLNHLEWREQTARFLFNVFLNFVEYFHLVVVTHFERIQITRAPNRRTVSQQGARKAQPLLQHIRAFTQLVNQLAFKSLLGFHMSATEHQVHCRFHAHQPWGTLCPARARQQT